MTINRRQFCKTALSFGASTALSSLWSDTAIAEPHKPWITPDGKIKIGLLWSLTGVLSVIEKPSRDVALFWVDQVNRNGGIAGMEVVPVEVDTMSDMRPYRDGITKLIKDERVLAVFGGYTSVSRRAVMPLVTLADHLFYYPTCYEGRECWQNIICTGPLANQHSFDLVPYMVKHFGPRAYFVGSNYIWPKESNRNAKNWLAKINGELVGEAYMPLGLGDFDDILADIKNKQPDWIFSTVVGDSDVYFRQQYIKSGLQPDKIPTASLTTSEVEVRAMGYEFGEGHYCSAPYFQSLDNPANKFFVDAFLSSPYGESGVTHANMESTYLSLLFFQKAVEVIVTAEGIKSLTPKRLRDMSGGLTLSTEESPQGPIKIDPDNYNSWMTPKIGRFDKQGQVEVMLDRGKWVEPRPFLLYPDRGVCRPDGLHLPGGKIIKAAS
jgi:urea transport system substrate-binding protein